METITKAIIYPSKASGTITVPSSKSLTHRAIILASLAKGKSTINGFSSSVDLMATINAMKALGAKIDIKGSTLEITGITNYEDTPSTVIDANESASTLRFIIPLLELFNKEFTIIGKESLFVRPMEVYEKLFKLSSSKFDLQVSDCKLLVKPKIINKPIHLDGSISSQFITGLLLYLPLRKENSKLIINNLVSFDYFLLTLQMMKLFGIEVNYEVSDNDTIINIEGNQEYKPIDYTVEGDYSQFANFLVLGTINNDIKVKGLSIGSLQGDKRLLNIFPNCKYNKGVFEINKSEFTDLTFDIKHNPDLGPILMAYFVTTGGKIENVNRLVYKESNRVEAMIEELKKIGANVSLVNDSVFIQKLDNYDFGEITFDSHNDHRIFMALAILSSIFKSKVTINNSKAVSKSYPKFIDDLRSLGIKINEEI